MQHDQAHALPDMLHDALDHDVIDLVMGGMAPPDQHVGFGQRRLGAAVLGLLQGRGLDRNIGVLLQQRRDLVVHAVRIVFGDNLVLLLVDVLAPDQGTDRHGYLLNFRVPGSGRLGGRRPSRSMERNSGPRSQFSE